MKRLVIIFDDDKFNELKNKKLELGYTWEQALRVGLGMEN